MPEKIKISIPKWTYDILYKDAENFNFLKKDGTVNFNQFLNVLIAHYFQDFSNADLALHDDLHQALSLLKERDKIETIDKILKVYAKNDKALDLGPTVTINFKPTKVSEYAVASIENVHLRYEAISSYYRRLLNKYISQPQNERELIIFKDVIALIKASIERNLQITVVLINDYAMKECSVHSIEAAKEELFNYVLVEQKKQPLTLRLSRIKNVFILNRARELTPLIAENFARQIKYGVQYPINLKERDTIIVKLSKTGERLFKRMYVYRPLVEKIEGDLYYFDCSYEAVLHYFKRFGQEAIIISPKSLQRQMMNFYFAASRRYREIANKTPTSSE